jgi:hypothetical protein
MVAIPAMSVTPQLGRSPREGTKRRQWQGEVLDVKA